MPDLDWIFYDTAPFNTTAGAVHELFQVPQGGDATHVENYTNMSGAGALPPNHKFLVKAISIYPEMDIGQEEIQKIFNKSFVEIIVGDRVFLKCPIAHLAAPQQFTRHYSQAAAADGENITFSGPLFELNIPIEIPGGTPFKVNITQVVATTAAEQVKCLLIGNLTRP